MILRLRCQEFSRNSVNVYILIPMCLTIRKNLARGGGYSLKWPIQGRTAEQVCALASLSYLVQEI